MLERSFALAAAALGAGDASPDDKLQRLLEAPQSDFAAKAVPVGPLFDGDLVRKTTKFSQLVENPDFEESFPAVRHCKRLVMGDCLMDVSRTPTHVPVTDCLRLGYGILYSSQDEDRFLTTGFG